MVERDVGLRDLTDKCEGDHRDSFFLCLLRDPGLAPHVEVQVTKVSDPLLTIS